MDIKLKKSKPTIFISWIAFFIGVNLLILSAIFGIPALIGYSPYVTASASDAFQSDPQNTDAFRETISKYLQVFLSMGTNTRISWNPEEFNGDTPVVAASEKITNASETQKEFMNLHLSLMDDKNVLYRINYDQKIIYSNDTDKQFGTSGENLPPEYNFVLYFDGSQVQIRKDNAQLDIYGTGFYTKGNDWFLPGYENFSAEDFLKDFTVLMAVRKDPHIYASSDSPDDKFGIRLNEFYWLYDSLKNTKTSLIWLAFLTLFGILFTGFTVRQYDLKKAGDRWIAKISKAVWIEFRAAAASILLAGFLYSQRFLIKDLLAGNFIHHTADFFNQYLYCQAERLPGFFAVIWLLYLIINDFRYNKNCPGKPFLPHLMKYLREKKPTFMIQKELNILWLPVFVFEVLLAILGLLLLVSAALLYAWGGILEEISVFLFAIPLFLLIFVMLALQWKYAKKYSYLTQDIVSLTTQIDKIHGGELTEPLTLEPDSQFYTVAEHLNDIQNGMELALQERLKSEQMKVELVSNVSHDLKTPLTSIISYVDLLKQEEENLPDDVQDYIHILDIKSKRLKSMVQDVFEISKAASRQLPINLNDLDFGKLLWQTLADMDEQISKSSILMKTNIPANPVMIHADGDRLYRVFQNLLQNALNYSLEHTRVFVALEIRDGVASASVKNISRDELPLQVDFTERFVRGDESRSDGGSGLGLSIAKSFTEACGGTFFVTTDADLFTATVEFPTIPFVQ